MMSSTKAMGVMNQQMNMGSMQKLAAAYARESAKAEMTSEMMDETFDDIFEGDDEMEGNVMDQIYDEIGLSISDAAPSAPTNVRTREAAIEEPKDIETRLASLRSL